MDHHGLHVFVWRLLRPLARLICRIKFGFTAVQTDVKGPFLFVANHLTDWDPILVGCSFKEQMYFVTSEHLLRVRFWGPVIKALQDPIPRMKSGSAADTVMTMLRRLRKGMNVAVFPEGNRCWDGVTGPFPPSTGKLARTAAAAGASLVTYKMTGGYFANPRWAGSRSRRGRMRGELVRVYAPEELRKMKPEEINEIIRRDIAEDAYERQRTEKVEFRGRNLAEHLETLLFLCPRCGKIHTLRSEGDLFRCSGCGLSVRYLPTGFLEGAPWDNIRDWLAWQTEKIHALCDEAGENAIFTDEQMRCYEVERSRGYELLGEGEMRLFRDRLELPGVTLPLGDIQGVSLRGPQDIYFGTAEHAYELRSDRPCCTHRYLTAVSYINGAEYGV